MRAGGEERIDPLHLKPVVVENIVVQLNPRDVAQDFQQQTQDHACHEAPGAMANAEEDLQGQSYSEDGKIERIPRQAREVFDLPPFRRAFIDGAERGVPPHIERNGAISRDIDGRVVRRHHGVLWGR